MKEYTACTRTPHWAPPHRKGERGGLILKKVSVFILIVIVEIACEEPRQGSSYAATRRMQRLWGEISPVLSLFMPFPTVSDIRQGVDGNLPLCLKKSVTFSVQGINQKVLKHRDKPAHRLMSREEIDAWLEMCCALWLLVYEEVSPAHGAQLSVSFFRLQTQSLITCHLRRLSTCVLAHVIRHPLQPMFVY